MKNPTIQIHQLDPDKMMTVRNLILKDKEIIFPENAILTNAKVVIVDGEAAAGTTAFEGVPNDPSQYDIHKTDHGVYWKRKKD